MRAKKRHISCSFNGTTRVVLFPFMIHSFFIRIPFEVCAHFLFQIGCVLLPCSRSTCTGQFVFIEHACWLAVCMRYEVRYLASLTTPLRIFLALASHGSLNHALYLCAFLLLFFRICVHQVMVLVLEGIRTYVPITHAGGEVLVHYLHTTYIKWNAVRDTFSIRAMFVPYPFNIYSISIFLKQSTVQEKETGCFFCFFGAYHT